MARIRTIKPEFFMSEDIGELTVMSRLLYAALWCHADRDGKGKFQRTALAAQCMPFEMDQFDQCWQELIEKKRLVQYAVNNKNYFYLPTFKEHQRPHHTEKESDIPDYDGGITDKEPLENRKSQEGIGKGKGKGKVSVHKAFTPPTVKEVKQYCDERGNDVDPERFVDFYTMKNWMVGKNKMVDWEAAVRTWEQKQDKPENPFKVAR